MQTNDVLEFLCTDPRAEVAEINRKCDGLVGSIQELRDELIYKRALLDALERTIGKTDWSYHLDRALVLLGQNFQ